MSRFLCCNKFGRDGISCHCKCTKTVESCAGEFFSETVIVVVVEEEEEEGAVSAIKLEFKTYQNCKCTTIVHSCRVYDKNCKCELRIRFRPSPPNTRIPY